MSSIDLDICVDRVLRLYDNLTKKKLERIVVTLSKFRDAVRAIALKKEDTDLLDLCDKLKDFILPFFGVKIEDEKGKDATVMVVDKREMMIDMEIRLKMFGKRMSIPPILGEQSNIETQTLECAMVFSKFRDDVMTEATKKKDADILKFCDELKDDIFPMLGIKFEDGESSKVKFVDKRELLKKIVDRMEISGVMESYYETFPYTPGVYYEMFADRPRQNPDLERIVVALSRFRDAVRAIALKRKDFDMLGPCDILRDVVLAYVGIKLEDERKECRGVVKFLDARDTLRDLKAMMIKSGFVMKDGYFSYVKLTIEREILECAMMFSEFRDNVMKEALKSQAANGDILKLCDDLKENIFPKIGIILEDGKVKSVKTKSEFMGDMAERLKKFREIMADPSISDEKSNIKHQILEYAKVLFKFRNDIKTLAPNENDDDLLKLCDKLKDYISSHGGKLEDEEDIVVRKFEDRWVLLQEMIARVEKVKLETAKMPPTEVVKSETPHSSAFGEKGIPTQDASGKSPMKLKHMLREYQKVKLETGMMPPSEMFMSETSRHRTMNYKGYLVDCVTHEILGKSQPVDEETTSDVE